MRYGGAGERSRWSGSDSWIRGSYTPRRTMAMSTSPCPASLSSWGGTCLIVPRGPHGSRRPRSRRSLRSALEPHLLSEDLLHHLVGAAADRAEARVAHGAPDLEVSVEHAERGLSDLEREAL